LARVDLAATSIDDFCFHSTDEVYFGSPVEPASLNEGNGMVASVLGSICSVETGARAADGVFGV
jgi:hypothetical protein